MFIRIPVDKVASNPFQTRTEIGDVDALASSIVAMEAARPETSGLLQVPPARLWDVDGEMCLPLDNIEGADEVLELLQGDGCVVQLAAGHRRLQAFRQLALDSAMVGMAVPFGTFPVELQALSDEQMADIAWTENAEREDVNAIDEALAIQAAMERFGWTQEQVASRWRLSRSGVANKLRLLKLPDEAQGAIRQGAISERHGRVLLSAMARSPAIYETVAGEVLPVTTPEGELLERVQEIARPYRRVFAPSSMEGVQCACCGGPVDVLNRQVYFRWDHRGQTYLCTACYRAGTGWTPPSLSDAEKDLAEVVRDMSCSLDNVTFPLDIIVGEGDADVQCARCAECSYRTDEGQTCLDRNCMDRKGEHWKSYQENRFLERLRARFGEIAPIRDEYGGVNLSSRDEVDVALVHDGICAPGKCDKLRFSRHYYDKTAFKPFDDLPFVYVCGYSSSHNACQRRWREAQRSRDEVEAEKLAKRLEKHNREQARALRDQALTAVSRALLSGNVTTWYRLARVFDYEVKQNLAAVDGYAAIAAGRILGHPEKAIYHWDAADALDLVQKQLRARLGELGIKMPANTDDIVQRLERIEGFILDESGAVRGDLTPEQIEGNLTNLDDLAMDLMQASQEGRVSELDDAKMNARVQELWAKLEKTRVEEVDKDKISWICHTSVDYAQRYIKQANLATLKAALEEEQSSSQRVSLIRTLESRIRKLEAKDAVPG